MTPMTEGHIEVAAASVGAITLAYFRLSFLLNKALNRWNIEHEMLVQDYCQRSGIKREDLPTRHAGGWK